MIGLVRPVRILAYHPRFTILAVLTLAAGIGANTAMFGLLDAVYFRPLPLADPDQLVDVTLVSPDNRFSIGPADTWSLVVGVVVCIAVVLSASLLPVWRAARMDPAVALRDE